MLKGGREEMNPHAGKPKAMTEDERRAGLEQPWAGNTKLDPAPEWGPSPQRGCHHPQWGRRLKGPGGWERAREGSGKDALNRSVARHAKGKDVVKRGHGPRPCRGLWG